MERREMAFRYKRRWYTVAVDVSEDEAVIVGKPRVRNPKDADPSDAGFASGKQDWKHEDCKTCAEKRARRQAEQQQPAESDDSPRGFGGFADKVKGAVGMAKSEFGIGHADDETIERRRTLCKGCEHQDLGVCGKCGCYCAAKVKLKTEKCPIGVW
tara:strand:- start:210 stop:677 length:468 start_codon:yes stop_codon:yes gene_type:complete